ncbi:SDR family oxidoreductase [Curtobacterium flaccumfaciens pv. oortii]|uniref:SDR family oxidoreductase n=1 Tax=Curtobacterium flaccumfaciens TaxID=2035 RepID=UPI002657C31D|nr:SDR family oxidoreductase [Curtobacterium flaccumfaciens]MCS5524735.1 SDR family oxidoreductase [Curtobacterium flaccumfaciens pv. oortii]
MHDIAVVTAGARGIGRQIAVDLRAAGYTVVLGDSVAAKAQATAAEIGDDVVGIALDVTNRPSITEAIAYVEGTIGSITLWVNNADVTPAGRFIEHGPVRAQDAINVNFAGTVESTAAILPEFVARRSGTIINLSSTAAAAPPAGFAVYSGTKAAVLVFSDSLRREMVGSGVTIRVVVPQLVSWPIRAGMSESKWFFAAAPAAVSAAVLRAVTSRRFALTVPRRRNFVFHLFVALPIALRSRIAASASVSSLRQGEAPVERTNRQHVLPTPRQEDRI